MPVARATHSNSDCNVTPNKPGSSLQTTKSRPSAANRCTECQAADLTLPMRMFDVGQTSMMAPEAFSREIANRWRAMISSRLSSTTTRSSAGFSSRFRRSRASEIRRRARQMRAIRMRIQVRNRLDRAAPKLAPTIAKPACFQAQSRVQSRARCGEPQTAPRDPPSESHLPAICRESSRRRDPNSQRMPRI